MSEDRLAFNRGAVRPMECLRDGWQLIKDDYWLFLGINLKGRDQPSSRQDTKSRRPITNTCAVKVFPSHARSEAE